MPSWTRRLRDLFVPQASGSLAAGDWEALVNFMRFRECPAAKQAIAGRQGCTADECSKLADELRTLRAEMLARGGSGVTYVERSDWQTLVEEARANPDKLDSRDLLRVMIVADAVPGIREQVSARLASLDPEARLVLSWAAEDTFDVVLAKQVIDAARAEAGDSEEGDADAIDGIAAWMLLLEPSPFARAQLAASAERYAEEWREYERGEDGDADEVFEIERARNTLHGAVLGAWDKGRPADAAFHTYVKSTFSYWTADECVTAACVSAQLARRSARDALAKLRGLIAEPIQPPAPIELEKDPAFRVLDAVARIVEQGKGLTVRAAKHRIQLEARPQQVDPDYF